MRPVTIPIRAEGTLHEEEALEFMPMPREMSTFEMPSVPEAGPDRDVPGACALLETFVADFGTWLAAGGPLPQMDLSAVPADALRVLNETLGEGEVSAIVDDGHAVRIQETVFSGVWREQHFDADGRLWHDWLTAAPVPPLLRELAQQRSQPRLRLRELPPGAMNVPSLVSELQEAMIRCENGVGGVPVAAAPHVVNLTLLPLSPEDQSHLDALLEGGGVTVLSRGFGNCRISSTAARHVWRVQYFNNMNTLILNTLEVVDFPEVAMAAREDLQDSHGRLLELAEWMRQTG